MGARRTLLRNINADRRDAKKYRKPGHAICEKPGTAGRRLSGEIRGTKAYFEELTIPARIIKGLQDGVLYDLHYHFTKGYRIHLARAE